jgi:hypothetical protein
MKLYLVRRDYNLMQKGAWQLFGRHYQPQLFQIFFSNKFYLKIKVKVYCTNRDVYNRNVAVIPMYRMS